MPRRIIIPSAVGVLIVLAAQELFPGRATGLVALWLAAFLVVAWNLDVLAQYSVSGATLAVTGLVLSGIGGIVAFTALSGHQPAVAAPTVSSPHARRLTESQTNTIRHELANFQGYSVDLIVRGDEDPESWQYSEDFQSLFQSLKWSVTVYPNTAMVASYPGLFIMAVQKNDPAATALFSALSGLGIRAKLGTMEERVLDGHTTKGITDHHVHINIAPLGLWP